MNKLKITGYQKKNNNTVTEEEGLGGWRGVNVCKVRPGGGGGGWGCSWVNFCWVCAAGLSEPLPHYSLFCGQL